MATLSDSDRALVRMLRDAGVLVDVDGHRLNQQEGVILVYCPDCDQREDVVERHEKMVLLHRKDPRIHPLGLNGGSLLIPPDSPLVQEDHEDRIMMKHIRGALGMKGIHTLALYAHAPCGMANTFSLTFDQIIAILVRAKAHVKTLCPDVKVACFVHVDKGSDARRTYFVPREAAENWFAANR